MTDINLGRGPAAPPLGEDRDKRYLLLGLRIVAEFGAVIALPVVLISWLGKRLDERFGTAPLLLIAAFVLSFTFSAIVIVRKSRRFAKEYEDLGKMPGAGCGK